MNLHSGAGKLIAANVATPKWIDLSLGYEYVIVFSNGTNAAIQAGPFTIQDAAPSAADPCLPDAATWADIVEDPECDDLPSVVAGPATVTFQGAANAIPAFSQCHVAAKCPRPFVRVTGTPGGLDIIAVLTRLKRSGNV